MKSLLFVVCSIALFAIPSCSDDNLEIPKPYAYYRVAFPEKQYTLFKDDACPFEFEYPAKYALVLPDTDLLSEPCWKNIIFPQFHAELNFSYKPIVGEQTLEKYLNDSWMLATKHQIKASAMSEDPIKKDSAKVYGLMFEIEGNAATNLQFYLTDSTRHFVRASLYFYSKPNYDSLAPIINFIKTDVERMINTFHWKDVKTGQTTQAIKKK